MKSIFTLAAIVAMGYTGAIAQDIIPDSQIEIIAVSPVMEDECNVDEMDGKCTEVINFDYCFDSYTSQICILKIDNKTVQIVLSHGRVKQ